VISHELRTPLNYITGFGSLLQDEVAGPMNAMQTEYLGKMLEGADRMLALVNDLLDVAKIQAGHLDIAPRTIPYGDLLDEVLDTMRPFAEKKAIQLTVRVDAPVTAEIDGPRVEQVLTNLLSNAIKFTPDHGSVTIRAYEHDRELVTQVIDTGRGIAAKDIPYLFTRFKQLDMSMTREAGGVGLGLAICKAIVEGHRGTIGVLSHPGEGSTFWFSLPLTAATEGLRLPPKPEILP